MARTGMGDVANSLKTLLKEKQAIQQKEAALLTNLGAVLNSMGYQLVPMNSGGAVGRMKAGARRSIQTVAPKAKRKPMSAAARKAVGRRMKAYWAKRRKAAEKSTK